jgi:hypothetical protein
MMIVVVVVVVVFVHHGASAGCHDQASCMRILRQYQDYHMDGHGKYKYK